MQKSALAIDGCFLIDLDRHSDERGFFQRLYCDREFAKLSLETKFPQLNFSFNKKANTLRGLHFQQTPHEEVKLLICMTG